MEINGKNYTVDELIEHINIDKNIPKKRKNGIVLRDSQIEILKKYKIEYENFTSLTSLIMEIEELINTLEEDYEDLEFLSEELTEMNYYNYTNK